MSSDPNGLLAVLNELNRDVARARPADLLQFCANWFHKKLELERRALRTDAASSGAPPATGDVPLDLAPDAVVPGDVSSFNGFSFPPPCPSDVGSATGGSGSAAPQFRNSWDSNASTTSTEEETELPSLVKLEPAPAGLGRRTSVSAESIRPDTQPARTTRGGRTGAIFPKTDAQQRRIYEAVGNHLLFRQLEKEQYDEVVMAMKEQQVPEGVTVIQQGDEVADYFYIVERGTLDVFKRPDGGGTFGLGEKVTSYGPGATFGELALMYAQPRAATVLATSPCTLWAVDRMTFRTILLDSSSRRRTLFDSLLKEVPLFEHMLDEERAKIADALEVRTYSVGDRPVQQGERGNEFFIIIEGHAEVKRRKAGAGPATGGAGYTGEGEVVVGHLGRGDYFGELALLNNAPRAASVVAAKNSGGTEEEENEGGEGSKMDMEDLQTEAGPVNPRPAKRLRRTDGKLKVALLSERAFTRLLGPLAGIMSRHARERYGVTAGAPAEPIAAPINSDVLAPDDVAPAVGDGSADWQLAPDQASGTQGVWLGKSPFA